MIFDPVILFCCFDAVDLWLLALFGRMNLSCVLHCWGRLQSFTYFFIYGFSKNNLFIIIIMFTFEVVSSICKVMTCIFA